MLFFTAALNYADRSAVASVFPLLRSSLHLSDYALAGIGTVFLWSYALGSPFAGSIADHKRRSTVLVGSLACWSVVMMLTSLARGAHSLLFLRALLGLAECAYIPSAYALLADHHDRKTRATAIGIHICGMNVGIVGGSTMAAALGQRLGWRSDFLVLGGMGLILAAICALVVTEGPLRRHKQATGKSFLADLDTLFRTPVYLWIAAASMLIAVVTWSLLNWLPLFFHEHFRMGLTASSFAASASMQSAAVIGAFCGGVLSDRLASTGVLRRRVTLLYISRFIGAPVLLLFLLPLSAIATCIAIFAYSLSIQLGSGGEIAAICETVKEEQQATALGMFNLANTVAGGVGILGTIYLQHSFGWTAAIACLAAVALAAGFSLVMAWRARSGRQALPNYT